VIVGWLHFFKAIDEALYKRVASIDRSYERLYDACKGWLERDDH
jgi:hypothetical protein